MRKSTLTALPLAALVLVTVLSGCSEADAPPTSDARSAATEQSGDLAELREAAMEGATTVSCPTKPITQMGVVLRIEGDCDMVDLELTGGVVIVDDVETLTVSGFGNVVYAEDLGTLTVSGSTNVVTWAGSGTQIEDTGISNVLTHG